jgi:hypothetical protein
MILRCLTRYGYTDTAIHENFKIQDTIGLGYIIKKDKFKITYINAQYINIAKIDKYDVDKLKVLILYVCLSVAMH